MLELNKIRQNTQEVIERLKIRNFDATETIDNVISLDDKRKSTQQTLDSLSAEANQIAKKIGLLIREGKKEEAESAKARTAELKIEQKELSA
ncbi:MAG: seryl-tRNA synthetase, partial [Sphingobacteriales bacterium]